MASEGIADTLSVELQLLLANARDSWKSFRKEVESDPINASVALQGGKGEGRTFGGGTAVLGPENYRKPEPAKPMAGLGTLLDQSLITRGAVGGSGFGPGVRPLPTASVNTVYGQVSPGVVLSPAEAAQIGQPLRTTTSRSAVAHTDREYGQYRVRAVRSGIMDPMSRGDYDREGGFQTAMAEIDYWNEQRARNRSDAAMGRQALKSQPFYGPGFNPDGTRGRRPGRTPASAAIGDPMRSSFGADSPRSDMFPNFRGAINAYAGVQFAGGLFAAQNQLAYAQTGAMGDRSAYAQAMIDNNPLANAIGSIPFGIGGGIVSAADYFSQGRIGGTRTLRMAGIQDDVTGGLRSIGDLRRTSALGGQYAGAMAAGGFSAQMAGYQMALANVEPERQLRANQLRAPFAAEVVAKEQDLKRLQESLPSSVYTGPLSLESTIKGKSDRFEMSLGADGRYDTNVKGARKSDLQPFIDYNNAQSALEDARKRMASVDEATKEIAARDVRNIETQMRLTKRFDAISANQINNSTMLAEAAGNAAIRGHSVATIGNQIQGQFQPQIIAAQAQIDAIRKEGGTVSQTQLAELDSLKTQKKIAIQQGYSGFYKGIISEMGGLRAGALGLAYRPFDAMREQANANFKSAITSVNEKGEVVTADQNSDVYQRAAARNKLELAQINQNERFQRRAIQTGLDATSTANAYRFGRNEYGAQAAELVGGTINQMREMSRGGFGKEAQQLRFNTIDQLDLMSRDYGLSFRAEQFDSQNMLIMNQRDAQDPSQVFQSIEDEKNKLRNADASPDKDEKTAGEITASADKLLTELPRIIQAAVEAVLAK